MLAVLKAAAWSVLSVVGFLAYCLLILVILILLGVTLIP